MGACGAGMATGVEQTCFEFGFRNWHINTYDGIKKNFFCCYINGNLENEIEIFTTNTRLNFKSNDDVTMVSYQYDQNVKFISNSIFTTFTNLEYLCIHYNNKLFTIKSDYFINAKSLKSLHVYENPVTTLEANVFVEASSLENINLMNCDIKSIHKLAFNNLPKLKRIFFQGNLIANLHPKTFSIIATLDWLKLTSGENCVDEDFLQVNRKFSEIEAKICKNCTYDMGKNDKEEYCLPINMPQTHLKIKLDKK